MDAVHHEHTGPDRTRFHIVGWGGQASTIVIVHHGLGEHALRYATVAEGLAPVPVWAYDVRGHGRSDGPRGDALGLGQLTDDLAELLPVIARLAGAERVILLGHSMGALVVLSWLARAADATGPVVGAAISAPPVRVERTIGVRAKIGLGRVLRRVIPGLRLGNEVDPSAVSHDEGEVARYRSDPLVHDRLSVRLGLSIIEDGERLVEAARGIRVPALIVAGSDDPIVTMGGVRELGAAWGHPDRTVEIIQGNRHEGHHERPAGRASWFHTVGSFVTRVAGAVGAT